MTKKYSLPEILPEIKKVLPDKDIDHHYSDLYCKVTRDTIHIVRRYEYYRMVSTFIDAITGELWYEIPFAYTGTWDK